MVNVVTEWVVTWTSTARLSDSVRTSSLTILTIGTIVAHDQINRTVWHDVQAKQVEEVVIVVVISYGVQVGTFCDGTPDVARSSSNHL